MSESVPPFRRIAAELAGRIAAGELLPGDRVPSTRAVMREWGVALATAAKALDLLRQQGLVETHPGAGTVVRTPAGGPRRTPTAAPTLTRARITAAAIRLADAEGLDAVSMRRLATELGVGPMSLYRHLAGKDELVHLMMRRIFAGRPLPTPPPSGWRERLSAVCRIQWSLYRAHGWLPELVSITRPRLIPEAMAHTEWTLATLAGLRLSHAERVREAITLPAFVRGLALAHAAEQAATKDTGLDNTEWWRLQEQEIRGYLESGRFPQLSTIDNSVVEDLDALFEHGLTRHLDGLAARLRLAP
ncbi:TetR/AcrR family transcriptional regulator C-terminal domain-containing protein [Crossiella cryophila]|uniref:DNA-binding transcriptional regulator YhcF (GntR family) n=1 Tax=Crossiella cryophila TaxID=43355 RepID=A0A7W7CJ74_9PSEU|nr:TetR/AcrR family transcriptional regulator C-terminal domain-containing protein [Crossiella cryophila]MBB4680761.1 DNA-binding transcriptional regulator YhcF (GntR family) [Crossiella cryophila]